MTSDCFFFHLIIYGQMKVEKLQQMTIFSYDHLGMGESAEIRADVNFIYDHLVQKVEKLQQMTIFSYG